MLIRRRNRSRYFFFEIIEPRQPGHERARFGQTLLRVINTAGLERGFGPDQEPFGTPSAHAKLEALPLAGRGVGDHPAEPAAKAEPATYGFEIAVLWGAPNSASVSLFNSTHNP